MFPGQLVTSTAIDQPGDDDQTIADAWETAYQASNGSNNSVLDIISHNTSSFASPPFRLTGLHGKQDPGFSFLVFQHNMSKGLEGCDKQ